MANNPTGMIDEATGNATWFVELQRKAEEANERGKRFSERHPRWSNETPEAYLCRVSMINLPKGYAFMQFELFAPYGAGGVYDYQKYGAITAGKATHRE